MAISTSFCTQAKNDLLSAGHCITATVALTGTTTSGTNTITSASSLAGLSVGDAISGAGLPTGSVITSLSGTTIGFGGGTSPGTATASASGVALTATGDALKIALIKATPSGTYGAASTNYSDVTGNTDESSGTGYTATGLALTNVSPVISGTTAYVNFSPNPSWTSATFNAAGCMIYNTNGRLGVTGRALSVHDFGGNQTVSAGTFTVVMPTAASATAILRIT